MNTLRNRFLIIVLIQTLLIFNCPSLIYGQSVIAKKQTFIKVKSIQVRINGEIAKNKRAIYSDIDDNLYMSSEDIHKIPDMKVSIDKIKNYVKVQYQNIKAVYSIISQFSFKGPRMGHQSINVSGVIYIPIADACDRIGIYSDYSKRYRTIQVWSKENVRLLKYLKNIRWSTISADENEAALRSIKENPYRYTQKLVRKIKDYYNYDYIRSEQWLSKNAGNFTNNELLVYEKEASYNHLNMTVEYYTSPALISYEFNKILINGILNKRVFIPTILPWYNSKFITSVEYNLEQQYNLIAVFDYKLNIRQLSDEEDNSGILPVKAKKKLSTSDSTYNLPLVTDINRWVWVKIQKKGQETTQTDSFIYSKSGYITKKIYLRYGPGEYEIWIGYCSTEGENGGPYYNNYESAYEFIIENTDTADKEFLLASDLIQSDSEEIIKLAEDITSGYINEYDKSVAIHDWLCKNIAYDTVALFSDNVNNYSALETLHKKMAVCNGYSRLNAALHRAVGIPTRLVYGVADKSGIFKESVNHAWNEVYLDGKWLVQDATWDAGGILLETQRFYFQYTRKYLFPDEITFSVDHKKVEIQNE